jgi:acyl carrier protein
MPTLLGIVCLIAALAAFVWADKKLLKRRIETAFAGREPLSDEQFFARFFHASGVRSDVSSKVRRVLAEQLGQDLSRLQSSDDFTQNLKFLFDADSMANVEIVLALEECFHIKITNEEAQAMHTVEDIVLVVHGKLRLSNDA